MDRYFAKTDAATASSEGFVRVTLRLGVDARVEKLTRGDRTNEKPPGG